MNLEQLLAGKTINVESEVLKAAIEKNLKEKTEKLVNSVAGLLESFDSTLKANVSRLRDLRRQEKQQTELVTNINRAFEYFKVSGNPLPFYAASNNHRGGEYFLRNLDADVELRNHDHEAWKVPTDFQVK